MEAVKRVFWDKAMTECIVSLTSHGERLYQCARTIYSIVRNTVKSKIVVTIYKGDMPYYKQAKDLQVLVDNEVVELIVADLDLGPHLKYFYAMQKYKDSVVITVDDDIIYDKKMVESLLRIHKANPTAVIANRCHRINTFNYKYWDKSIRKIGWSHYNFGTGVGGILYPPGCFNLSMDMVSEINRVKYADDIYLKILELRNDIMVYNACNLKYAAMRDKGIEATALYHSNLQQNRNNEYIDRFRKDFEGLLH